MNSMKIDSGKKETEIKGDIPRVHIGRRETKTNKNNV